MASTTAGPAWDSDTNTSVKRHQESTTRCQRSQEPSRPRAVTSATPIILKQISSSIRTDRSQYTQNPALFFHSALWTTSSVHRALTFCTHGPDATRSSQCSVDTLHQQCLGIWHWLANCKGA